MIIIAYSSNFVDSYESVCVGSFYIFKRFFCHLKLHFHKCNKLTSLEKFYLKSYDISEKEIKTVSTMKTCEIISTFSTSNESQIRILNLNCIIILLRFHQIEEVSKWALIFNYNLRINNVWKKLETVI